MHVDVVTGRRLHRRSRAPSWLREEEGGRGRRRERRGDGADKLVSRSSTPQRLNAAGVASQRALAKNKGKRSREKKMKIKRVKKRGWSSRDEREKRIKLIA